MFISAISIAKANSLMAVPCSPYTGSGKGQEKAEIGEEFAQFRLPLQR